MGGFIKFTLRESDKITTRTIGTSEFNNFISDYGDLLENDIENKIKEAAISKNDITDEYHPELELLTPIDYGYIFIDRVEKQAFLINNYDSITIFSNYNFDPENYEQLKKQDYIIKVSNWKNKGLGKHDIRKEYLTRDFLEYKKLYTSLPYVKTITYVSEEESKEISDISSLESILDELMKHREAKKIKNGIRGRGNYINDLQITEFTDWEINEYNKSLSAYRILFKHLNDHQLISPEEMDIWCREIEEVKRLYGEDEEY